MKRTPGLLAVLLLVACSNVDIEQLPTAVTLTLDKTSAAVGEEVSVTVDATGTFLAEVVLDFGDGTPELTEVVNGAQTFFAQRSHTYQVAGSYTVTVTAREFTDESVTDSETVEVTEGGG